jgi:hypothetical protein
VTGKIERKVSAREKGGTSVGQIDALYGPQRKKIKMMDQVKLLKKLSIQYKPSGATD